MSGGVRSPPVLIWAYGLTVYLILWLLLTTMCSLSETRFSNNLLLISYTGIGCVVQSKLFELDITSSPTRCFILFLFNVRNENLCQTVYSILSMYPVIVTSTRIKLIACT